MHPGPVVFGVTAKLFLAILAVAIIVTLAMGAALRWNFERDFFNYIQARESARAERIVISLAALYQRDGGWSNVRRNPNHWRHLLSVPPAWPPDDEPPVTGTTDPLTGTSLFDPSSMIDPHAATGAGDGAVLTPGSPELAIAHSRLATVSEPPFPLVGESDRRLPPPSPYTLLDDKEKWLAGAASPPPSAPRRPISVAGKDVGWLITPLPERIPDDTDVRFQTQQREATWIIGLLAVVLAALASIGLARIVLAPVRRLARGTRALVAGEYAARVKVGSDDELGRLALDFNRLAETLQRNESLRREWFADISHELRTPLAIMRGELEALQDRIRPVTPQALQSLQSEVARLNKLIDDLYELALSDVGALTYRMSAVQLDALVSDQVQAFAMRLGDKGIEIERHLAVTPAIQGDAQRLSQLIINLLENALRYTQPPGKVRIATRQEGRHVVLTVEDTPPGVPPDALPRLFDRLFRVDSSRSRGSGGAGLGLAICERIVESHHGTIRAMHSELGGLCIRIDIPVSPEATHEGRRQP